VISAVTGFGLSASGLSEIGERVWNLERMLLVTEGLSRKDDTLPARFFEEALPEGNARGAIMDRSGFERMLSEYYELRGWDVETGVPLQRTLERLDLVSVPHNE
jgi:aldehyde:ferredoxin oxidoreductase